MLLEICANSFTSAMNAQMAGAHRVELCASLETGGVTPSAGTIQLTCHTLKRAYNDHLCKPHVLIRPRAGDFCYTPIEVGIMRRDILFCREAGADGVALGLLNNDGTIDMKNTSNLVQLAAPLSLTFHRAFDQVADPFEALERLIELGFDTVLTSGQAPTAWEGRHLLQRLVEQAAGRIDIMPGAGINASNIRPLAEATGATCFHLSAKQRVQRTPPSGVALFEPAYWETDVMEVERLLAIGL